jgi:preprotein translocase subunit SecA
MQQGHEAFHFAPVALPGGLPAHRVVPRPGPVFGPYPLRGVAELPASEALAWAQARLRVEGLPSKRVQERFMARYQACLAQLQTVPEAELDGWTTWIKARLAIEGFTHTRVAESFALIALQVRRQLGFTLHRPQLLAAWWMLGNRLAEMATGEGKTLAVLLTAATAAMAGIPVHVLTANDYLAERDALRLAPLYRSLGLGVACVLGHSTPDERRAAYACDLAYATASEVAFDHLRDRCALVEAGVLADASQATSPPVGSAPPRPVLRGLCMAVVDEADSILIDDARTPLILSRPADTRAQGERLRLALFLARQLREGQDFDLADATAGPSLTRAGRARLGHLCERMDGAWAMQRWREEQILLALAALRQFHRDVHYLVRDGGVHIVDANTGRIAIGRMWSRGLHQLVALKEGLAPPQENETLTQTTYQRFFPRYLRLCGLSGTLFEARHELLAIYGLPVARVPLRSPSLRQGGPVQVLATAEQKWARVLERVRAMHAQGRPVLVGTDSVADSEHLAAALQAAGLPHRVLNARQDARQDAYEAEVIEQAGARGAITVSTHMAGRGTDIPLGEGVNELGGLHVINCHLHAARRVDRQLHGRCARQGMRGSFERIVSLEDEPFGRAYSAAPLRLLRSRAALTGILGRVTAGLCVRWAQHRFEARERRARWAMLRHDSWLAKGLAWAGGHPWG